MASRKRPDLRAELRVAPGSRFKLSRFDPEATYGYDRSAAGDKVEAKVEADLARLDELQERVWAEHKHRILIILQGIDTAGKDGVIKHLMRAFNAHGSHVVAFGVPTKPELAHDYLWRIHAALPGDGEIVMFNRSHYESVLVERVHKLVPKKRWSKRYDQINDFERLLADEGTTILKFMLIIDRDEQLERFQARFDDPRKRWKFQMADLEERKLWDQYLAAFEDAINRCSTDIAPWYVIPANRKWFRDLAIGEIARATMEDLKPAYPVRDDLPDNLELV